MHVHVHVRLRLRVRVRVRLRVRVRVRVMSCHVMSCHVMSCQVKSSQVKSGQVKSGQVMSCHVMPSLHYLVAHHTLLRVWCRRVVHNLRCHVQCLWYDSFPVCRNDAGGLATEPPLSTHSTAPTQ